MQVARTRIVAKPSPNLQHIVEWRVGERASGRERSHPTLPVRNHGGNSRLLQHDFADPRSVGIALPPPRQVPFGPSVPFGQDARDGYITCIRCAYRHGPGVGIVVERSQAAAQTAGLNPVCAAIASRSSCMVAACPRLA